MRAFWLIVFVLLTGCSKNPATGDLDFVVLNEEQEYFMGRNNRNNIPNSKIYKDVEKQKYFNNLAQKIYSKGERPEKDFTFYLLNSDEINAFALPGYVFLNRGILPFVMDEASLAAVLAHEIGHINARHSVQDVSNEFLIDWLLNSIRKSGYLHDYDLSSIKTLGLSAYSRKEEYEADKLALRYLNKMKMPPENSMLIYKALAKSSELRLKTLNLNENKKTKAVSPPEFLSTHPLSEKRATRVASLTNRWYEEISLYNQEDFYKQLDGMEYGYFKQQRKDGFATGGDLDISNRSGVYGFKNIAYLKKDGLKMVMPKEYQARIMGSDPIGYNYKKGIKVSVYNVSDDKNIDSLDIFADILDLDLKQRHDLLTKIGEQNKNNKDSDKIKNSLKEKQSIFSYIDSASILDKFLGENTQYFYIYIEQTNDLDQKGQHQDLMNDFRIIILSSNSKKSFDESMLDDILFIKDNLIKLTDKQKSKIGPLRIKTVKAKSIESIESLAPENVPYINFEEEWFKLINGIYDEFETDIYKDQWIKLIPNSNKNI